MSTRFPFDLSSFSTSIYPVSSVKQCRHYLDTSITHLDEEDISRRGLVIKRRRARERERKKRNQNRGILRRRKKSFGHVQIKTHQIFCSMRGSSSLYECLCSLIIFLAQMRQLLRSNCVRRTTTTTTTTVVETAHYCSIYA